MLFWENGRVITRSIMRLGRPRQKSFVESLHGKFRSECLSGQRFKALEEAKYEVDLWREHYNIVRPNSSLNYLPPVEYTKQGA
jgi:putative transposase